MDRTIIKGAEWMMSPETAEGAPQGIYGAQCLACAEESGLVDDDSRPVGVWAIAHTRDHPTHQQFLVRTERHWRVDPTPAVQAGGPAVACEAAPGARVHAKPRPLRLRPAVSSALRRVVAYSGLLFLVGLAVSCGVVIGMTLATA
ncbi:hypothetical protein [Streptomyces sp. XD-27]|uniref:DUF7848 domain-containing protein n=1 Tax=Streptomyces sp. XD-27 TaxID=3062779 RepID=UPI0026F44DBE|nr:hypothetical protein [Streptomyces sp. XD-27]WKX72115.1 hypothetical protein Q3Y56_21400 [Streptomyces sp. XD-27]